MRGSSNQGGATKVNPKVLSFCNFAIHNDVHLLNNEKYARIKCYNLSAYYIKN